MASCHQQAKLRPPGARTLRNLRHPAMSVSGAGEKGGCVADVRITNEKELEAWLKDKPREWAVAIAARAALRVLPRWKGFRTLKSLRKRYRPEEVVLSLFRGVAISRLSAFVTYRSMPNAARSAAAAAFGAARSRGAADAYFARFAARSAASAARSATVPARACAAAFSAARSAAMADFQGSGWQAVEADAAALDKSLPSVITGHLWRKWDGNDGSPAAIRSSIDPPEGVTSDWAALKHQLGFADSWQVWTEWYEDILEGRSAWGLSHDAGNEIMFTALTWPEEEWSKGPAHVNRRMAELIEAARARATEPVPIPEAEPAAIEPVWIAGTMTLAARAAQSPLKGKALSAALAALQAELRELATDAKGGANIDPRAVAFLEQLADRVPPKAPP